MGATKSQLYSINEIQSALIARAFAHPARIKIFQLLKQKEVYNNSELSKRLGLNISTVHTHLNKMLDANVISVQYKKNEIVLALNQAIVDQVSFSVGKDAKC